MRRFIIATNKKIEALNGAKVIEMEIGDLPLIFNQDCLNVVNERQYQQLLKSSYMYGIEVKFDNYLTGYRKLLNQLYTNDNQLICIFDVSIKRFINNSELSYFANNKLLPSKLFNIEIETVGNKCTYTTIGLESIGLKEFKFESNLYLNEEDFQIFKAVVTNYLIGKHASVYINANKIKYNLIDGQVFMEFSYNRPSRIYEFFVRDDMYLVKIRYDLIKHNWQPFLELYRSKPELGEYLINKSKVYDIFNFEVGHAEELTIVTSEINYNQDNLFYAYKYL